MNRTMADQRRSAQDVYSSLSKELLEIINSAELNLAECVRRGTAFCTNDAKSGFKFMLVLFLMKAIDISRSVMAILKDDITLWREATGLGRGLLEVFISARIMKTDPLKMCERFDRFDCVRRYKFVEQVSKLSDDMKLLFEADIKKKDELIDEYKKFLADYQPQQLHNWHGLSEGEALEKINEAGEDAWIWKVIYRFQSDYVHNESRALSEYLHEAPQSFEISRSVIPEDIHRLLMTITILFIGLFEICNQVLDFKRDDYITSLLEKLKQHKPPSVVEDNAMP